MTAVIPPTNSGVAESFDEIRFSDLLDTLLQHIWLVCGFFFVALAIGVGYSIIATPIYSADALIQVEQKKSSALSGVQEIADALGTGAIPVSGEIEILTSREVILKAVEATHADVQVRPKRFPIIGEWLSRRYDGVGPAAPYFGLSSYAWGGESLRLDDFRVPEIAFGKTFTLKVTQDGYALLGENEQELASGQVGQVMEFHLGKQTGRIFVGELVASPGTEFFITRYAPSNTYRRVLLDLAVSEAGKQSSVMRVSYKHPDVSFAQNLVNGIAKAYLVQNVERRSAEADQSLKFLDEQLPTIKRSVERAEDALNNFRTKTNTVSVEKSIDTLLQQSIELERDRMQLQLKKDELRQLYRPEHPELKAIDSQIEAMTDRSRNITDRVNRLPEAQRDLLRLQRDAEVSNQLYIALLNNAQQLRVAKAGTVGNVRVIDFAVRDTVPVAPAKHIIIAASALVGLLLGVGAAFIARLLRPTVREASEVEKATGLVSYVSVPESRVQEKLLSAKRGRRGKEAIIEGRNQLLAVLSPDDIAVESLRSLRTGLAFATMGATNKNIVITGATAALGKSFVSANLSALLASSGKKVLLVETDMRRPQLGAYFGYADRAGLSEVLAGSVALDQAILHGGSGLDSLDVLFSGQVPPNPGELLLSSRFTDMLESLQDKYDHILLDSAPILPVGDTLAVARNASTIFLVVRAEISTVSEVRDSVRKLGAVGIAVKGLIFNGVKQQRIGYGSAYRYYYGYGKS